MKRFHVEHFAALLCLLPALALAQPAPGGSCNPSATCAANKFSLVLGKQLCFNSTTCTDTISASATTSGMLFNSAVANSGTNNAYIFDTTATLSGSTNLLSIRNATSQKLSLAYDGTLIITGAFSAAGQLQGSRIIGNPVSDPIQLLGLVSDGGTAVAVFSDNIPALTTAGSKLYSFRNNTVEKAYVDYLGNYYGGGGANPVPVLHTAQSAAAQAIEYGKTAATGGALAVTFATAFASAPTCTCVITAAVPVACGITTAANTTSVTFTAGAGTDVINWICIGAK